MGSLHIETNSQPVLDTDPATYLATHLGSELLCGTVGIQFRRFRCPEAVLSGSSSLRSISVRSEFGWQRRLDPRRYRAQNSSTRHDASQFITARRITAQHLSRYITIDPSSISSACRLVRCLERFPCFTFLDSFPGSWVNHF